MTRGFRIRFCGPALKPRPKWPYLQADCGNDGETRHEGRAGYALKCLVYRKHWFFRNVCIPQQQSLKSQASRRSSGMSKLNHPCSMSSLDC